MTNKSFNDQLTMTNDQQGIKLFNNNRRRSRSRGSRPEGRYNVGIWDLVIGILFGFWILSFGFPANAWRITPELQEELTAKKTAVRENPNDPAVLFDLAIAYSYTNHIIDGMNTLKKVHEIDPKFKLEAKKMYIKKVTENPGDWKLRFRLAFAYFAADDKQDAIRELNNVLIIDPYNVWAYGYLALIYGEMGDVDKAMELTKKGLKIDNKVAALHLLLAEGYYKKGDGWRGFFERLEALRLRALGY